MPEVADELPMEATRASAKREARLKLILTGIFVLTVLGSAAVLFSKLAWLNSFAPS